MTQQEAQLEFSKDLEARRPHLAKMNFHYLMYKGVSLLNKTLDKKTIEDIGLNIHVPRTFMTIESVRPDLNNPIDIICKWRNRKEKEQAERSSATLRGEWLRSKSDFEKAEAETDALIYGSGYLLSKFVQEKETTQMFKEYDKEGRPVFEEGERIAYEGMKAIRLDPFYVIPDRKAKTYKHGKHNSPRHIWVYSIWDYNTFIEYCKKNKYSTKNIAKGGFLEELDFIKRTIDTIYSQNLEYLKTRDGGVLVSNTNGEVVSKIEEDSIMVVEKYTPEGWTMYAGANWTEVDTTKNLQKRIPISVLKDYDIPGELEGIGEAEVLRWQQYEENKIHNLAYLQVLINTVQRYAIAPEMLKDPTQVKANNPLRLIELKYQPGVKINDIVQPINQANSNSYPEKFLNEVKNIGQSATGMSDYNIGASESQVSTLGEAQLMTGAGNKRIKQKIKTMEEAGLTPILEHWQICIPQLYTEELDYLLNDGLETVKFLPYNRDKNNDANIIAEYSVKEGIQTATTLEELFTKAGYKDVVFISDLVGGYDIAIKCSLAFLDRNDLIKQYQTTIAICQGENVNKANSGQPPVWDTGKLTEELLRQFPDIIEDVNEYKIESANTAMPTGMPVETPTSPPVMSTANLNTNPSDEVTTPVPEENINSAIM